MALDFISLLLSKDAPKQADQTMSPHLKQFVKPATLGMDMWQNMPVDKEIQDTDHAIARGYRMDSLQTCATSLLDAASRLEKTVRRETRYWENVLSVSERGWSICRMPREKHNLGVRFGFLEALGEYRERGLAALRADESGNVILDKGLGNDSKFVRIRTRRGNQIVGISSSPPRIDGAETNLEGRIRAARDSLYEEELFHEMIRESRTLASYGVDMRQSTICVPTRLDARLKDAATIVFDTILVDLVSIDDMGSEELRNQTHDQMAQTVAVVFRLLLSYAHGERLKRRSETPPPMSLAKPDAAVVSILRPVLSMLHHQSIAKDVDNCLDRLGSLLGSASIEAHVKPARFDRSLLGEAEDIDRLMEKMLALVHTQSSLHVNLPGRSEPLSFILHVSSSTAAPTLGCRIQLQSPVGPRVVDFTEMDDLIDHLDAMVGSGLILGISSGLPGWKLNERLGFVSNADNSRKVTVLVESGLVDASAGQLSLEHDGQSTQWTCEGTEDTKRFWDVVGSIE